MDTPHYPLLPKEQSRELRCAIRRVYLEVWDPIGVQYEPNAQNEYDGYIGKVFELLVLNGSDEEILDYLFLITNENMGLTATKEQLRPTVTTLRQIPIPR